VLVARASHLAAVITMVVNVPMKNRIDT